MVTRGSTSISRLLLARVREVMAARGAAQTRLDKLVTTIASTMDADVCSIYIRRAGDELELYATKGLDLKAVHKTRLKIGVGLVGEIAELAKPLNLRDAPSHPKFEYRPETGEDPFHSFLGVPIHRGGHVLGVIVVQKRDEREYSVEVQEALETIATLLTEVVASGQVIDLDEHVIETEVRPTRPYKQGGVPFARGLAFGHVVLHDAPVAIAKVVAEDVEVELARLSAGINVMQKQIDALLTASDGSLVGESYEVLETYRMFARDSGWARRMEEAVQNGLTAEAAVRQVQSDTRARMLRQKDSFLRDRLYDLDDLANRLMRHLVGELSPSERPDFPDDAIILARNLGPAELLDYDVNHVRGVILEEGAANNHVAIVARALGVPMIGQANDILDHVNEGDLAIVDGHAGDIHVRPAADVVEVYEDKLAMQTKREAELQSHRDEKAVTKDGQHIKLSMNAGLLVDLPNLDVVGAEGIGLFRTELQFMISATMPRLKAQSHFYSQVLDAAGDRPVTFRTLDLGGDKILPYGLTRREENPAMGLRAIRLALSRPSMLRYQLRALLKAAEGRNLNLMFPMVSEVDEFLEARALLDAEMERRVKIGKGLPYKVRVGCMLEVPSLVWNIRTLLPHVDFVSVGSNDLMQFFYAADRGNPDLNNYYDFLSPSLLSFLKSIVMECQKANVSLSLCGEAAGRPLEAMALIGLGFRNISMPPSSIGAVKLMAQGLHVGELEKFMTGLFERSDHSVRMELKMFAENQGLSV